MYLNDSRSKSDRPLLRGIVHFLWLMETIQSVLALCDGFEWFVYHFGDYNSLVDYYNAAISNPIADSIIAFPVQLVYCWRIWVLSGWRLLPSAIAFLALVAASAGFVQGINNQIVGSVTRIQPNMWFPIVEKKLWYGASAVTDILIAVSMAYLLLKFKSEKYLSRNLRSILRRLLIFTLEANILTAFIALVILALALVEPIGPYVFDTNRGYNIGKVYSNCFMILLNQRSSRPSRESRQMNGNQGTFSTEIIELSQPHPVLIRSDPANISYGQISAIRFNSVQGKSKSEDP
ncbi:hypothetical protein NP233_g6891 [Leucocoprinus birnbaumii]|uniref:DUF6534 domain-containing protein n=1 Tax=Leucocoprinus birnbaumii TaxID=56174 RepID=A0AAD5VTL1_9AGAR|nr:hypothetical protein NP233_g6891 [Leucocoprinus birnbaumii]